MARAKDAGFFSPAHFDEKKNHLPLRPSNARVAQLVEHDLAKVGVAGSNPVSRSKIVVM